MMLERRILERILPTGWFQRIDLETRGIRQLVEYAAEDLPSGAIVLDSGAGQCPYRHFFKRQKYIGVDFALGESAWDYSRLDVISLSDRLPFSDNQFDAVLCTQVLEHVPEPEALLRETCRVTRPGGRLFLTAPLGFGEHQQPYDYYRYTRFGLRYLLEKAGFTVKSIKPRGGYFWYLAVMLMWLYIYFFPKTRSRFAKWLMSPLQVLGLILFVAVFPPMLSFLDFLDTEKSITLGFAVVAEKQAESSTLE